MGILWEKFEELEHWLKKYKPLRNECFERLVMLINLDGLMTKGTLEEEIRKVDAFNEYLSFRHVREKSHQEMSIIIKKPQDLKEKSENPEYSEYDRYRLGEIYSLYENSISSRQILERWDSGPYLGILGENCGMITGRRIKKEYYFQRSPEAEKIIVDLKQSWRSNGLLEFYSKKDEIFKKSR
jgi:hypothetical protein